MYALWRAWCMQSNIPCISQGTSHFSSTWAGSLEDISYSRAYTLTCYAHQNHNLASNSNDCCTLGLQNDSPHLLFTSSQSHCKTCAFLTWLTATQMQGFYPWMINTKAWPSRGRHDWYSRPNSKTRGWAHYIIAHASMPMHRLIDHDLVGHWI